MSTLRQVHVVGAGLAGLAASLQRAKAGGVTFKCTQQLSYYAEFGYQFALTSNTGISGFIGDMGLRYTW